MKFFNAQITGSMSLTGSFEIPVSTTTGSYPNLETGSLLLHVEGQDRFLRVFNGTSWVKVSEQSTPAASADIEYLVVAGGGAGGYRSSAGTWYNGGGGAGGYLSSSLTAIESGSSITVTVGGGGSQYSGGSTFGNGTNGSDSSIASATGTSFDTVTSTGGGRGACIDHPSSDSSVVNQNGADGGSGGGATGWNNNAGTGGSGTVGQGNNGGSGTNGTDGGGAGGGGAGGVGTTNTGTGGRDGGNGGAGKQSAITGTATYYAAGARGGKGWSSSGGVDGSDGTGYSAAANTGNGGQPGIPTAVGTDTAGNSGVVILAYDSSSINAIGGHEGDAGNGRKYHKFGTSGTFYIGGTSEFAYVTDDLLMHYDFANASTWDGSSSTITDLQGNHNLTVNSSPTLDLTHGGGLSLDGVDDYASKESSISFTPYMAEIWLTSDIAIDTSIYSDSTYASPLALGVYPGGFTFGAYTGNMTSETIAFWGANYTSTGATYIRDTFSAGTYQIVANWNGSTYDIWVNGSKKTTYAMSTYGNTTLHARDSIILGKEDHASQSYEFGGRIHNVKIYSAQKTDAEVTQNWNALRNRFGL